MGQSCTRPLQKVSNVQGNICTSSNSLTTSNKGFADNSQNVPNTQSYPPSMVQTYFSFSTFFEESKDPKIYEWAFTKKIGDGAMSSVFLVKNVETEDICAAKVYNSGQLLRQTLGQDEPPYEYVKREISIMSSLSHRYILSIIEVIEDDYTNSLILIEPYASKGSLQTLLDDKNGTEINLACCFFQVAEGLRYLHSNNIVHRDLKPDNILCFSDSYFVISDFSISTKLEFPDQHLTNLKGTPAFLSPEACNSTEFSPKEADVWAYGISLYLALFGKLPFGLDEELGGDLATQLLTVTEHLNNNELIIPENCDVNLNAIQLLQKLLNKDPHMRPTFEEIVLDPWFQDAREIDRLNEGNKEEEEASNP